MESDAGKRLGVSHFSFSFIRLLLECSNARLCKALLDSKDYFLRSTRVLEEADSDYRPQPGMMTAAQQVTHTAQTLDWFVQGATRPEGFDLDFAAHAKALEEAKSLAVARTMLEASYTRAIGFLKTVTSEQLAKPLPEGPVMGGEPLSAIVWAMIEHTAHGVLARTR